MRVARSLWHEVGLGCRIEFYGPRAGVYVYDAYPIAGGHFQWGDGRQLRPQTARHIERLPNATVDDDGTINLDG